MSIPKTAVVFGVTGQDGSYLSELLLSKGYTVIGVSRRSSTPNDSRIRHLLETPGFRIVQGDVTDAFSVHRILSDSSPCEVYNLAAQSHVGVSFAEPSHTWQATACGALNILESIRILDPRGIRFYQASSSEMFGSSVSRGVLNQDGTRHDGYLRFPECVLEGKRTDLYQDEATPMCPNSPYAVAKLAAHHLCRVYRESYGVFAASGILFNHECLSARTPLLVRDNGTMSVRTPDELVSVRNKGANVQHFSPSCLEIWDGDQWTVVKAVTATRRRKNDPDHTVLSIQARCGTTEVTGNHKMLRADGSEVSASDVVAGDMLSIASAMPNVAGWTCLTDEMAEFLGLMAAEGHISRYEARFTNRDDDLRRRVAELWSKLFLGGTSDGEGRSGFNDEVIPYVSLRGGGQHLYQWLRSILYHPDGSKRVPDLVLNGPLDVQARFVEGHYAGDGLKAGSGDSVTTSSPVLALGLIALYENQGRRCSVYKEQRGDCSYYRINIRSCSIGNKGRHLVKPAGEVREIVVSNEQTEWVFDLETETKKLMVGVGRVVVHNSERRGIEFVTRKIVRYVAALTQWKKQIEDDEPGGVLFDTRLTPGYVSVIRLNKNREPYGHRDAWACGAKFPMLKLGNLDACRDWGHAEDFVRGMWMMLQQDKPDDFVLATGETHSVREFLHAAFAVVGEAADAADALVRSDPAMVRPCEVSYLRGDASKARTVLGWRPEVGFGDLVRRMVLYELK